MTEETLLEVRLDGTGAPSSTDALVRPLDAGDLRLMAAWAAQELGPELAFAFNGAPSAPDGRISILPDPGEAAPDDVLVRARTVGRPVTLESLSAQVADAEPAQIAADQYGAAFWSESAVQKFLFPYLTALAGGGAVQVLADLDRIWNGYPDGLPVIALLHRSRRREGLSLKVGELLDVMYLDSIDGTSELRVAAAADFLSLCGDPVRSSADRQVDYGRGTLGSDPQLPSEYLLRRIAEWAAAVREEPLYFLLDTATGAWRNPVGVLPADLTDLQVIPVFTPPTRGRPPVTMTLVPHGGQPITLDPGNANAAFWHSGTVTKVLLPYYALAYGASELREVLALYHAWTGEVVEAPAGEPAVGEEATSAFAVIHLPKSDWEEASLPASAVASTLGMAVASGPPVPGGVRTTRLARLRGTALV
jgi:hypothetical protein